MARRKTAEEIEKEIAKIKAELARLKGNDSNDSNTKEHTVEEADKVCAEAFKKEVATPTEQQSRFTLGTKTAEARHVRGNACKIECRDVRCRKCDMKFLSDESQMFESNIVGRVVCVCPACEAENLINARLTIFSSAKG